MPLSPFWIRVRIWTCCGENKKAIYFIIRVEDVSTKVSCSNRKGDAVFASVFLKVLCSLGLPVPREDAELACLRWLLAGELKQVPCSGRGSGPLEMFFVCSDVQPPDNAAGQQRILMVIYRKTLYSCIKGNRRDCKLDANTSPFEILPEWCTGAVVPNIFKVKFSLVEATI